MEKINFSFSLPKTSRISKFLQTIPVEDRTIIIVEALSDFIHAQSSSMENNSTSLKEVLPETKISIEPNVPSVQTNEIKSSPEEPLIKAPEPAGVIKTTEDTQPLIISEGVLESPKEPEKVQTKSPLDRLTKSVLGAPSKRTSGLSFIWD